MAEQRVSINDIRKRFAEEGIELSTDITIRVNLSIGPNGDGDNVALLNVIAEDGDGIEDYVAYAVLQEDGVRWNLDTLAETFDIAPDAEVWDVVDDETLEADAAAAAANLREKRGEV